MKVNIYGKNHYGYPCSFRKDRKEIKSFGKIFHD